MFGHYDRSKEKAGEKEGDRKRRYNERRCSRNNNNTRQLLARFFKLFQCSPRPSCSQYASRSGCGGGGKGAAQEGVHQGARGMQALLESVLVGAELGEDLVQVGHRACMLRFAFTAAYLAIELERMHRVSDSNARKWRCAVQQRTELPWRLASGAGRTRCGSLWAAMWLVRVTLTALKRATDLARTAAAPMAAATRGRLGQRRCAQQPLRQPRRAHRDDPPRRGRRRRAQPACHHDPRRRLPACHCRAAAAQAHADRGRPQPWRRRLPSSTLLPRPPPVQQALCLRHRQQRH